MKIGVDIGGTTISAGIFQDNLQLLHTKTIDTNHQAGPETVIRRVCDMLQSLMRQAELPLEVVDYIGIGCAGMIDRPTGCVLYSNNVSWHNVELGRTVSANFGKQVYVENDAICAALGEYAVGAGKEYTSMLMVTIGTGIGGGIVMDNKLYKGFNGYAGAIGHMTVEQSGLPCNCGRRGCWEVYASTTALIRMATESATKNPNSLLNKLYLRDGKFNGRNVFEAIREGDATAGEVFNRFEQYLSGGISSLVNVLNPQMVVISGGICCEGELLLQQVRKSVLKQIYCGEGTMPIIETAKLGNDAGIVGAACIPMYI